MRPTDDNPAPSPLPSDHICKLRNKRNACYEWDPVAAQCLVASLVLILDELDKFFPDGLTTDSEPSPLVSEDLDKAIENLTLLSLFSKGTLQTLLRLYSIEKKLFKVFFVTTNLHRESLNTIELIRDSSGLLSMPIGLPVRVAEPEDLKEQDKSNFAAQKEAAQWIGSDVVELTTRAIYRIVAHIRAVKFLTRHKVLRDPDLRVDLHLVTTPPPVLSIDDPYETVCQLFPPVTYNLNPFLDPKNPAEAVYLRDLFPEFMANLTFSGTVHSMAYLAALIKAPPDKTSTPELQNVQTILKVSH